MNGNRNAVVDIRKVGMVEAIVNLARKNNTTRVIMKVPVELLKIDKRYQTDSRTKRNMSYLVNNWDEHKLLPLTVVPHEEEGCFMIVDGYGRLNASQIVDAIKYMELDCLIILDAPREVEERLKFEAEQFAFQNKNVAKLKPYHKHGACQIMEDKAVLILDRMKEKYGFEYADGQGRRGCNTLGSYTECICLGRAYGENALDFIFEICQRCGFDRLPNGYSTYIVRAFKDAYLLYANDREIVKEALIKKLRGITPEILKSKSNTKYPILDYKSAVSLFVEDVIVKELHLNPCRKVEGNKVIKIVA